MSTGIRHSAVPQPNSRPVVHLGLALCRLKCTVCCNSDESAVTAAKVRITSSHGCRLHYKATLIGQRDRILQADQHYKASHSQSSLHQRPLPSEPSDWLLLLRAFNRRTDQDGSGCSAQAAWAFPDACAHELGHGKSLQCVMKGAKYCRSSHSPPASFYRRRSRSPSQNSVTHTTPSSPSSIPRP
jgi:hypothetical protein